MKRILILEPNATGGRKIVKSARKLGYLIFGVTQKNVFEKMYEKQFADQFEGIHFTDFSNEENSINDICDYAKRQKIDAVLSGFEFMSNLTVKVASKLNLLTHDYMKADALRNKGLMYEHFVENNVPTAKTIIVESLEQLQSIKHDINFPLIIKPADNGGSCGVFKVQDFDELINCYNLIIDNSIEFPHGFQLSQQVLLQEILDGKEFSVEIAIIDGQSQVLCITDKMTTEGTYFAELGHTLPTMESPEKQKLINEVALESIKALGLQNGVAHAELKFTQEGPKIIEVGARLPGDYIPELLELALGIDEAEVYLKAALGEPMDLIPVKNNYAAIRFIPVSNSGNFEQLVFMDHIKDYEFTFSQYVKSGDIVAPSQDNISRIGHIICASDSYNDVVSKCSEILANVQVNILEEVM
ncbi:ATP-grasp domain-containing protein [Priestia megaterium]|uniref:ATP-grasp domain-containing protein n=1 Tax=Priestia megaterium TaxID=1404 RepID=UPI002E1A5074|nr:ATP-grasp domain-containing protein [Priestia megaterium]